MAVLKNKPPYTYRRKVNDEKELREMDKSLILSLPGINTTKRVYQKKSYIVDKRENVVWSNAQDLIHYYDITSEKYLELITQDSFIRLVQKPIQ